jgi:hypothetical protein
MTDKPDMCAALRKWADRLRDENSTLAESLAVYADAWEAERAEAGKEIGRLNNIRSELTAALANALTWTIEGKCGEWHSPGKEKTQ